jgi:hypothetical protein
MKKRKQKYWYIHFWMRSRGQSSASLTKAYSQRPTRAQLVMELNDWTDEFSHLDYTAGFEPVDSDTLPKNRRYAIKQYHKYCDMAEHWKCKKESMERLLALPPFNGENTMKAK